jgi:hypothetical protein
MVLAVVSVFKPAIVEKEYTSVKVSLTVVIRSPPVGTRNNVEIGCPVDADCSIDVACPCEDVNSES